MRAVLALAWCVAVIGCSSVDGEQLGPGTISIQFGDSSPKLAVGAAVDQGAETMLVQIGSDNVDCNTNLQWFDVPEGTFVSVEVPRLPGTYTYPYIEAAQNADGDTNIRRAQGSVTIDAITNRVTGSLTVAITDAELGVITAQGSFDVIKCFDRS